MYTRKSQADVRKHERLSQKTRNQALSGSDACDRFVERLVAESRLPDPDVAALVGKSFWDLI